MITAVEITLNGERRSLAGASSVGALLETLAIDPRMVAVERNRSVVRRADYAATPIHDGDEIEIVAFVGGG